MHLAQREAAADVVNSAILLCAATKPEDTNSEEKLKPVIPNTPKPQVILAAWLQKHHFRTLLCIRRIIYHQNRYSIHEFVREKVSWAVNELRERILRVPIVRTKSTDVHRVPDNIFGHCCACSMLPSHPGEHMQKGANGLLANTKGAMQQQLQHSDSEIRSWD